MNYRDTKDCIAARIRELQAESRLHDPNTFEAWELSEKIRDFIRQFEELDNCEVPTPPKPEPYLPSSVQFDHEGVAINSIPGAKPARRFPRVVICVAAFYLVLAVLGAFIR